MIGRHLSIERLTSHGVHPDRRWTPTSESLYRGGKSLTCGLRWETWQTNGKNEKESRERLYRSFSICRALFAPRSRVSKCSRTAGDAGDALRDDTDFCGFNRDSDIGHNGGSRYGYRHDYLCTFGEYRRRLRGDWRDVHPDWKHADLHLSAFSGELHIRSYSNRSNAYNQDECAFVTGDGESGSKQRRSGLRPIDGCRGFAQYLHRDGNRVYSERNGHAHSILRHRQDLRHSPRNVHAFLRELPGHGFDQWRGRCGHIRVLLRRYEQPREFKHVNFEHSYCLHCD
jgi:hypothetical protein